MTTPIKSFVIRNGRCSTRQNLSYLYGLVKYGLSLHTKPWDFTKIFQSQSPVVVELGFGMGQSLLQMASAAPQINFVGIEVHRPGIGQILSELLRLNLSNVRIVPFDAVPVFQHYIPPESLERIQIYFPDPWPKKRHYKRRLLQQPFIQTLARALKPGGYLHCATDWAPYAEFMLEQLQRCDMLLNTSPQGRFVEQPSWRPSTKFELRGKRLGHEVFDLLYCKLDKKIE